MRLPWWYGVAGATLVWAVEVLALEVVPESSPLGRRVSGPLALVALGAWLVMPLSIYLDHRTHGDELAWNPSTALWVVGSLVWLLNIAVGGTYCLRRQVAVRRSAPSRHWHSIVVGSIVVWTGLVALDQTLPAAAVSGTTMDGITGLVALAWIGLPIAILFDAVRIRGYTDWNPNVRVLVFGAAIPLVNVVVGAAYLYKRRAEFDGVDPTQAFVLRDDGNPGTDESGVASSPWFRRAGYVFGAYFLFVVLIGAVTPSLSGASFELLALLAWVPFGPLFAGCVYRDTTWRREHGRHVGEWWWLYLLSGLVQGAAFWYLLRRVTGSNRHRMRHRASGNAED